MKIIENGTGACESHWLFSLPAHYSKPLVLDQNGFEYVDTIFSVSKIVSHVVWGGIQEAKYGESWPNTTTAWAGLSRFDIPVDRYGGVHSLLICTSSILGSPTCHWASQQENTYSTKYQKADRASTLVNLWVESNQKKPNNSKSLLGPTVCEIMWSGVMCPPPLPSVSARESARM
jgi:hypothetical protein